MRATLVGAASFVLTAFGVVGVWRGLEWAMGFRTAESYRGMVAFMACLAAVFVAIVVSTLVEDEAKP